MKIFNKIVIYEIVLSFVFISFSYSQFITEPDENSRNLKFLISFSGEKDQKSDFYKLYNFFKDFFVQWKIQIPMNIEVSAKFSTNGINSKRYVIQLQKEFLQKDNPKQIEDMLLLVPNQDIRNALSKYLKDKDNYGAFGYGEDFQNTNQRFKVYYNNLYGRESDFIIDSYEWDQKDKSQILRRIYKDINNFEIYIDEFLTKDKKNSFQDLKKFINFKLILLKKYGNNNQSLELKFKDGLRIMDIKSKLIPFLKSYYDDSEKLNKFLYKNRFAYISWLHLGKNEASIYLRIRKWIYKFK